MRIARVQRTAGDVDGALLVYGELIRDDESRCADRARDCPETVSERYRHDLFRDLV
jgi:hypothetical protein